MQNGYYMFIYSEIDPVFNILQLFSRHDHNMAVFQKNGYEVKLICHLEFERFSGIKHHNVAFHNTDDCSTYLNKLLEPYNLSMKNFVGIYGTPGLMREEPNLSFSSIFDLKDISYHAVSHLFSSMILDTEIYYNNDIIALAFDGGSDRVLDKDVDSKFFFCGAVSRKGKTDYFPISSPGGYWLYLSDFFNKPEGTLMALAYASKTRSIENFEELPPFFKSSDRMKVAAALNNIIDRVFSYTQDDICRLYVEPDDRYTEEENKISMVIKIVQRLSIDNVSNQINFIIKKYNLSANDTIIALSGGYALNCPTNTYIMEKYHFKDQLCIPCVNDSGLSIGMGLYFFNKYMKNFHYRFEGAFYGYSDESGLQDTLVKYEKYIDSIEPRSCHAAVDIEREPVIWIDGRSESGPRALGHRSIIANPAKVSHKSLLNVYKQREWWRPVAPIVIEGELNKWFIHTFKSPYMLNNFTVRSEMAGKIPAVLHLDQTARVQSINRLQDPNMFKVISEFYERTGIPMVCNTSLNDKGEPIINSVEQAINFALRKHIDIIYAYGTRICLKNHEKYSEHSCLDRDSTDFTAYKDKKSQLLMQINPHNLTYSDLMIYLENPSLHNYDLRKAEDVTKLTVILRKLKKASKYLQHTSMFKEP